MKQSSSHHVVILSDLIYVTCNQNHFCMFVPSFMSVPDKLCQLMSCAHQCSDASFSEPYSSSFVRLLLLRLVKQTKKLIAALNPLTHSDMVHVGATESKMSDYFSSVWFGFFSIYFITSHIYLKFYYTVVALSSSN